MDTTIQTTVDAHMGYHRTGMVIRALTEVRTAAADYTSDAAELAPEHDAWWTAVLTPIHAAKVAILEASPEQMSAAAQALGITVEDGQPVELWDRTADGVEDQAADARRILAALRG